MPGIEPCYGDIVRFWRPQGNGRQGLADERDASGQIPGYCPCPESSVVPYQEIAGEIDKECHDEESESEEPVPLPRRRVGLGDENADRMQRHENDHCLTSPIMNVAYEKPVRRNMTDVLD